MTQDEDSARLARGWIEAWQRMDMAWLREHLAPGFVHVTPSGMRNFRVMDPSGNRIASGEAVRGASGG